MALTVVITLLSLVFTGTTVDSASNNTCTGCSPGGYCNAGRCTHICNQLQGVCNMTCSPSVKYCDQFCYGDGCSSKCDAEKCSLVCTGGACNMTCPSGVKECNLYCVRGGSCNSKCNAEKCSLDCGGGACNMTCPSGVKECHLNCADGKCHFNCDAEHCQRNCAGGCRTPIDPGSYITCSRCWPPSYCNAEKCTLPCTWGGCNMSCPSSVKYCDQICTGGRCRSKCDAEKCVLDCTGGGCNMACPSGVKECNLYCTGGGCHFDCDAEKCTLDCTGGGCTEVKSTTTKRPGSSSGSSLQVGAAVGLFSMLALVAFV